MISHCDSPWTPHYALYFTEQGHEVSVVSFRPGVVEGVRTVSLAVDRERSKLAYLSCAPRVRRILRAFGPDVVLATYVISNGLTAALAWRGPLLVSARGGDVLDQPGNPPLPPWLRRALVRFVCGRAGRVHAVSEEIAESLRAWGVSADRIQSFPMGVDVERFRPGEERRADARTCHILCTRAHDAVYRNDVIVEAMARLRAAGRSVRCTFVGGGPLLDERRRQVERLGVAEAVAFLPEVGNESMPEIVRSADIFVSASESDGTSSSLMEALACGLVPVVSRIRANRPWVREGETGLMFAVGDPADLARAIGAALDRPDLRAIARRENPRLVQEKANQRVNNGRLLCELARLAGPEH